MLKRDLVLAVREMINRNLDVYEIAARLKLDPVTIQATIDFINNVVT
jgi:hypothetical protein